MSGLAHSGPLPTASEAMLAGLVLAQKQPVEMRLPVASVGNVLCALVNRMVGR